MILSELREFPLCATRIFEARRVGAEPGERDALARLAATQFRLSISRSGAGPPSMTAVPQRHTSKAPAALCSSGRDAACCLRHPQACPSMSRKTPSMTTKAATARDTAATKTAARPRSATCMDGAPASVNKSSVNEHFNYPRLPCGNVALNCPFITRNTAACTASLAAAPRASGRPWLARPAAARIGALASSLLRSVGALCTLSVIPLLHSSGKACYAQRRRG